MEGAPMLDTTTFVGLDVHARSIKAVSFDVMTGEACRQGRAEAGREARGPTRARGPRQNVATARELACWVWAVGLMAEEA